jgi:serine/threonine protein kinase
VSAPWLPPGQIVAGRFTLKGLIAHAEGAATYQAIVAPGREVVLKVFSPALLASPAATAMFEHVAAINEALPPDSAIPVLERWQDPETGAPFLVTPLSVHPSLAELVRLCPLSVAEAAAVAASIARVLDPAHAARIVHHALKPTNVFLGPAPAHAAHLMDFGMNALRAAAGLVEPRALPWLAPEQHVAEPAWIGADVYALALLVYFAIAGRSLLRGTDAASLAAESASIAASGAGSLAARAREDGVSWSSEFEAAMARALAASPNDRFESAGAFAAELLDAAPASMVVSPGAPTTGVHATMRSSEARISIGAASPSTSLITGSQPRLAVATAASSSALLTGSQPRLAVAAPVAPPPEPAAPSAPPRPRALAATMMPRIMTPTPTPAPAFPTPKLAPGMRSGKTPLPSPAVASVASVAPAAPAATDATTPDAVPSFDVPPPPFAIQAISAPSPPAPAAAPIAAPTLPPAQPHVEVAPPVAHVAIAAPSAVWSPPVEAPAVASADVRMFGVPTPMPAPAVVGIGLASEAPAPKPSRRGLVVGVVVAVLALAGLSVAAFVVVPRFTAGGTKTAGKASGPTSADEPSEAPEPVEKDKKPKPSVEASTDEPSGKPAASSAAPATSGSSAPSAVASTTPSSAPSVVPSASVAAPAGDGDVALEITCSPPCDTITVDGAPAKSPVTVAAGRHVLVGSKKGYESQGKVLEAKAGTTQKIYFPLAKTGAKKDCGKFLKRCD